MAPVEYKIGTVHGLAANVQLCAQALCIEEMTAMAVPVGFIWYATPRRRGRVAIDDGLRHLTKNAIETVRQIMCADKLPAAVNDQRCRTCQFLDHCQPELSSAPHRIELYMARELGCGT